MKTHPFARLNSPDKNMFIPLQPHTFNLFVYGSLMPGKDAYANLCSAYIKLHFPAYIYGDYHAQQGGYPMVNTYNIRIQSFPHVILAGMMGYKEETLFEASEQDMKDVEVKF